MPVSLYPVRCTRAHTHLAQKAWQHLSALSPFCQAQQSFFIPISNAQTACAGCASSGPLSSSSCRHPLAAHIRIIAELKHSASTRRAARLLRTAFRCKSLLQGRCVSRAPQAVHTSSALWITNGASRQFWSASRRAPAYTELQTDCGPWVWQLRSGQADARPEYQHTGSSQGKCSLVITFVRLVDASSAVSRTPRCRKSSAAAAIRRVPLPVCSYVHPTLWICSSLSAATR